MGNGNQSQTRKKAIVASVGHHATPSRRQFLIGAGGIVTSAILPTLAAANVPIPYDWNAAPPAGA